MIHSPRFKMCLATGVLTATAGAFAQDYDLFQLPMPPGWSLMFPSALNDNGHMIGVDTEGFWFMPRGFYFDGVTSYEFAQPFIETLPYESWAVGVRPLDINNHNHVLFTLEILDVGGFSYLWDGENFNAIQPDVPGSVGASSINNHGVIVGTYNHEPQPFVLVNRGWVYDQTAGTTIIIEPPAPFEHSVALDISDTGYVTGYVFGGPIVATGFIWKDGDMTLFEGVDEDDYLSISRSVNDNGYAGAFTTNSPPMGTPSMSRVFLWSKQDGAIAWEYPHAPFNGISVSGINNSNEIVGTMIGPQQPFHFHNGVLRNLNNHIPQPDDGTTLDLWDAYGLNELGQIAAHGIYIGGGDWSNYAFILTPKPGCSLGDLNCDGVVNVFDLLQLLAEWGPCPAEGACPADLDGDGLVNVFDLLQLLAVWG